MSDGKVDPLRIVPAEVMRDLARMVAERIADQKLEEERQAVGAPVVRFNGASCEVLAAPG